MKILLLIDNFGTGGAQRQLVNLALGLHKRGLDVAFFCYATGSLLADEVMLANIPIHFQQKKSRFSLEIILKLRKFLRADKFDLILSFLPTPNFYAISAAQFLMQKPRVIVSERSYDPPTGATTINKFIRIFYIFADHITVNSRHQTENLKRNYPWLKKRISTIYNGYDLGRFSPGNNESDKEKPLKALVIASISTIKNGLCLVRALQALKQRGIPVEVSWVGRQDMVGERLAYRKKMNAEIENLGVASQWKWLGERSDIPELLHSHDVLIHPSYGEGLPNAVCEALACGRPVILSNTLDHPYLVEDGITGYLFDWTSSDSLARAIEKFHLLKEYDKREMSKHARKFAEQNLSLESYVDQYEQLFGELIN